MTISRNVLAALAAVAVGLGIGARASAAVITPADLTTGGTAFSAGGTNFGDGPADRAFDDVATTKVGMNTTGEVSVATPAIVGYTFAAGAPALVLSYSLTSANDGQNRDPRDFTLQGSNDAFATAGTVVDTRTGITFVDTDGVSGDRFETLFFTVQTPGTTPFSSYRLVTTETRGLTNGDFQFAELQLFPTVVVPEPTSLGLLAAAGLLLVRRRRTA